MDGRASARDICLHDAGDRRLPSSAYFPGGDTTALLLVGMEEGATAFSRWMEAFLTEGVERLIKQDPPVEHVCAPLLISNHSSFGRHSRVSFEHAAHSSEMCRLNDPCRRQMGGFGELSELRRAVVPCATFHWLQQ